jgi:hypothetical protein
VLEKPVPDRKECPVEEREKLNPAEPEGDVEAHKKVSPAANEEPKTEGDSDDDVEIHRKIHPA